MEWVEYYDLEKFGGNLDDTLNAQMCTVLANCHRNPKIKREPFKLSDFTLSRGPEVERILTPKEKEKHLDLIFGA